MKQGRLYTLLFTVLAGIYLSLVWIIPPDQAVATRFGLTPAHVKLISLTIVVPLLAIWWAAYYGFRTLSHYARTIRRSTDGQAFIHISRGLGWLAFGLPLQAIISNVFTYQARRTPGLHPAQVIIQNYVNLIIYFVAFIFISRGAAILIKYVNKSVNYGEQTVWVLVHIILAVFYTYFIIGQPFHGINQGEIYYMPTLLVLLTLTIPYLFLWYISLRSAYRMHFYSRTVKGELYRKSLGFLTTGILFIILSTISLQLVTTLSGSIERLSLSEILMILYVLLIIMSLGFIQVAVGSNRLKRLEEI